MVWHTNTLMFTAHDEVKIKLEHLTTHTYCQDLSELYQASSERVVFTPSSPTKIKENLCKNLFGILFA